MESAGGHLGLSLAGICGVSMNSHLIRCQYEANRAISSSRSIILILFISRGNQKYAGIAWQAGNA